MAKAMDDGTFQRILGDIESSARDAEDLPEVPPHEFRMIAFVAPVDEQRCSRRCMTCWIRTGFSFRYERAHPHNELCFHCLRTWVPQGRR